MDDKPIFQCWLCGQERTPTLEHVPPRGAFNSRPVILERVSDTAIEEGYVSWEDGPLMNRGLAFESLCSNCNNRLGDVFAPSYIELARKVHIGLIEQTHLDILPVKEVRNPQFILRQILLQFVTTNGAEWVRSDPWVKEFLLSRKPVALPVDVRVYLFCTRSNCARTSGISGHVLIQENVYRICSEFTYPPLGTVLAYTEMDESRLLPIHSWSKLPFKSKTRIDIELPVNEIVSAYPVDFRSESEILEHQTKQAQQLPDERTVEKMCSEVERISGGREKNILTAHPSYHDLL